MKIVMTMMVRDEVDIIAPVIEFHLDQGVDLIMVTDNASVDGTSEVLEQYADLGVVELHHDLEHRKQQGSVVTAMARRAFVAHGADWVVNADADEFLVPLDRSLTVREALERTPKSLGAFTVPVVNLVGPPALQGSGIDRLVWRDGRSTADLVAVGIHAQPTPNAIHVGDAGVTVAQGNHFVSLQSHGQPEPEVAMEVLHLPWRSWSQFEQKVIKAGLGYEASPHLKPSKNHHGMADFRRSRAGRLQEAFYLRLPLRGDLEQGRSYERDDWLATTLHELVDRARIPGLLTAALSSEADHPVGDEAHARAAELGAKFLALEQERDAYRDQVTLLERQNGKLRQRAKRLRGERDALASGSVRADIRRLLRRVAVGLRRRLPG